MFWKNKIENRINWGLRKRFIFCLFIYFNSVSFSAKAFQSSPHCKSLNNSLHLVGKSRTALYISYSNQKLSWYPHTCSYWYKVACPMYDSNNLYHTILCTYFVWWFSWLPSILPYNFNINICAFWWYTASIYDLADNHQNQIK